jgi:hypothetical protein
MAQVVMVSLPFALALVLYGVGTYRLRQVHQRERAVGLSFQELSELRYNRFWPEKFRAMALGLVLLTATALGRALTRAAGPWAYVGWALVLLGALGGGVILAAAVAKVKTKR